MCLSCVSVELVRGVEEVGGTARVRVGEAAEHGGETDPEGFEDDAVTRDRDAFNLNDEDEVIEQDQTHQQLEDEDHILSPGEGETIAGSTSDTDWEVTWDVGDLDDDSFWIDEDDVVRARQGQHDLDLGAGDGGDSDGDVGADSGGAGGGGRRGVRLGAAGREVHEDEPVAELDQLPHSERSQWKASYGTLFELAAEAAVRDIDGDELDLTQFEGHVLLIVNVASECGYTVSGYEQLIKLHQRYAARGLVILAFPCNQFLSQEPGDEAAISQFVRDTFPDVAFPLMSKVNVNEDDDPDAAPVAPIYKWLKLAFPGEIGWNFEAKFIVDRHGVPIARIDTQQLEPVEEALDALLG